MKNLIKLEEAAQLAGSVAALAWLGAPWWAYLLMAIGPDVGMVGYLAGPRTGAITYNLFHHKGLALAVAAVALFTSPAPWLIAAAVLYGHASLDRLFGFGLKYPDQFKHTHLGWIGGAGPQP